MNKIYSQDGTPIAYDKAGDGPLLILISGALGVRQHPAATDLMAQLQPSFTVINYDRRGRGDSGDTGPYAVAREVQDIEALIDEAGEPAYLYGMSSGGVLALECTNSLQQKVKKVAIYEPPFIIDDSRPPVPDDLGTQLDQAIEAGHPGEAVEIFMTEALRMPQEVVAQMKSPQAEDGDEDAGKPAMWQEMENVAHTLPYDVHLMSGTQSGKPLPPHRWADVNAPVMVIVGGKSDEFFHSGAKALAAILPDAHVRVLEGQDHAVAPTALAPLLHDFLSG